MATTKKVRSALLKIHPEKPWTKKERYRKWVNRLSRSQPRRNTRKEDLCVGRKNICTGDLGIPRKYMPQFATKEELQKFLKFIRKAYHIDTKKTTRRANELRPSQGEISRIRIKKLIEEPFAILKKVKVPLLISKDNFIVDGHHRWAAYRLKLPHKPLPVIVVNAPIKDVLGVAVAWGAKHEDF
jgi:hypothetical protein